MGSYSKSDRRCHKMLKRLGNKRRRGSGKAKHRRYVGQGSKRPLRMGDRDRVKRYQYVGRGKWERVG